MLYSPSAVARDKNGRLYVASSWTSTIAIFAPGADEDAPPIGSIRGGNTGLDHPAGIAIDSSGKLYVANLGIASYDTKFDSPGGITVYAAGAEGNVAPIAAIKGVKTRLYHCSGVAVDPSGKVYATNYAKDRSSGSVNIFATGANGDIAPTQLSADPKLGWFARLASREMQAEKSTSRIAAPIRHPLRLVQTVFKYSQPAPTGMSRRPRPSRAMPLLLVRPLGDSTRCERKHFRGESSQFGIWAYLCPTASPCIRRLAMGTSRRSGLSKVILYGSTLLNDQLKDWHWIQAESST